MFRHFRKEQDGSVMVEMAISITLLLVVTLGFVDFGYAYYQWNAATKAVQAGARLASISNPVATALTGAGPTDVPGAPMEPGDFSPFQCTSTGGISCTGFSAANFNRIFYGDPDAGGANTCVPVAGRRAGMCDFFPLLQPANVVVTYTASGLGYQTRQAGPVPTVTVSLQNVTFQFFFLGGLLGFNNIAMPSMLSTVTGEDMKSDFVP
jgi:Flp pilus assembly protein TadG